MRRQLVALVAGLVLLTTLGGKAARPLEYYGAGPSYDVARKCGQLPIASCDNDLDRKVSILDLSNVARHYGEHLTTQVRVVVVGFADRPIPSGSEAIVCGDWIPKLQQWFRTAQRDFDASCTSYTSPRPITDFGPQDDCGQGVDTGKFRQGVEYDELHLNTGGANDNQWRNWFVIIGGGGDGHTSAQVTIPESDIGDNSASVIDGDWQLNFALNGAPDACCLTHDTYGPGDCFYVGPKVLSQEALNSMSAASYTYPTDVGIWWPDPLPSAAISALHDDALNGQWLYRPNDSVPPATLTNSQQTVLADIDGGNHQGCLNASIAGYDWYAHGRLGVSMSGKTEAAAWWSIQRECHYHGSGVSIETRYPELWALTNGGWQRLTSTIYGSQENLATFASCSCPDPGSGPVFPLPADGHAIQFYGVHAGLPSGTLGVWATVQVRLVPADPSAYVLVNAGNDGFPYTGDLFFGKYKRLPVDGSWLAVNGSNLSAAQLQTNPPPVR